jgi:hypothetical protein
LVQEAPTPETRKQTHSALVKEVQAAKRRWANDLLHNATPEQLWAAAKWCRGRTQRLIPALTTHTGLSDDPLKMADAL